MMNPETELWFDEENLTTPEEVLKTKMEELLIKRKGETNPFLDVLESSLKESDEIYLNDKSQLIKIVKKETETGRVKEIHNILTFDVSKLKQATQH